MKRRLFARQLLSTHAIGAFATQSVNLLAQDKFPERPLRMIVPFSPGGASDFVGRIIQPEFVRSENARFAKVIKEANIEVD